MFQPDQIEGVEVTVCLFFRSGLISHSLDNAKTIKYRYELISADERSIILFDKEMGSYWQNFIVESDGISE